MRHLLAARPVTASPRRVGQAPRTAGLVALARGSHRSPPAHLCTGPPAIDVAAVAARAQHHHRGTAGAQKHARDLKAHRRPRPEPKPNGQAGRAMQYCKRKPANPLRVARCGGAAAFEPPRTRRRRASFYFGSAQYPAAAPPVTSWKSLANRGPCAFGPSEWGPCGRPEEIERDLIRYRARADQFVIALGLRQITALSGRHSHTGGEN